MSKYIKTTIILLTFLLFVLGIVYFPIVNLNYTKNTLKNWISTNKETEITKRKIRNYKNGDTFDTITNEFYSNYDFILSNKNPFDLKITLIQENKNTKLVQFEVFDLKRKFLVDYDLVETTTGTIQNKSFSEAVELAKKYDFSKENPDPENITVEQPPTREEVEAARKRNDVSDDKANNKDYQKETSECYSVWNEQIMPYVNIVKIGGKDVIEFREYTREEERILAPFGKQRNACLANVDKKYGY